MCLILPTFEKPDPDEYTTTDGEGLWNRHSNTPAAAQGLGFEVSFEGPSLLISFYDQKTVLMTISNCILMKQELR